MIKRSDLPTISAVRSAIHTGGRKWDEGLKEKSRTEGDYVLSEPQRVPKTPLSHRVAAQSHEAPLLFTPAPVTTAYGWGVLIPSSNRFQGFKGYHSYSDIFSTTKISTRSAHRWMRVTARHNVCEPKSLIQHHCQFRRGREKKRTPP